MKKYGKIEIRDCDQNLIYHNYGKENDISILAGVAIKKFEALGYSIKSFDRGRYWELTDIKGKNQDVCIEIETIDWFGLDAECDDVCDCINEYKEA
jgi:hypothetical protein